MIDFDWFLWGLIFDWFWLSLIDFNSFLIWGYSLGGYSLGVYSRCHRFGSLRATHLSRNNLENPSAYPLFREQTIFYRALRPKGLRRKALWIWKNIVCCLWLLSKGALPWVDRTMGELLCIRSFIGFCDCINYLTKFKKNFKQNGFSHSSPISVRRQAWPSLAWLGQAWPGPAWRAQPSPKPSR